MNEEFENLKLEEYNKYVRNLAQNSKKHPGKFWKFINGKRKSKSLPGKLMYNNKSAITDEEKANLFAEFFASVFIERPIDVELETFIEERDDTGFFDVQITPEIVEKVLLGMDLAKGQGPDRIPPIFLRECASSLATPLSVIYETSTGTGIYPNKFKLSEVSAIYKDGKRTDITNYRGAAVMPNLAKVFERVVHDQMKLIINPRVAKTHHGFVSNRSVESNLMEFTHYTHIAYEIGAQVDVFYSDVGKAFDTVNQPLSIRKLAKYPIGNRTLRWFNSYSSNRKLRVRVGAAVSEEFDAHSAVGQGTILGPTMFLTFFEESDGSIGAARSYNFADDKKKAMIIKTDEDAQKLQEEIDDFVQWCDDNGLALNIKKCKIMTFTHKRSPIIANYNIRGVNIERVNETSDLGVTMDPKLCFALQREIAKKKADNCLGFVKRESYKALNIDNARLLYGALVRPHLEYASVIWSPYASSHNEQMESTQKQAVIFLHRDNINRRENDYVLAPYRERCVELGLTSLNRRRVNSSALWIHKIISGRIDSPYLRNQMEIYDGERVTRNPDFIKLQHSRTKYGWNSPFNNACKAFNCAANMVDPTLPYDEFKKQVINLPDEAFKNLVKL